METNKLFDTWQKLDREVKPKSNIEMEQILSAKVKQTLAKFSALIIIDVVCCLGFTAFLLITSLNRLSDPYYLLNNIVLGVIVIAAMIISLWSFSKLNTKNANTTLKEQFEQQISLLSKWLQGKYKWGYFVLTPIILLMVLLSIHIYYENSPLLDVLKNEESIFGIIFGFAFGLAVAYFVIFRIRKFQLVNLNKLKDIYNSL